MKFAIRQWEQTMWRQGSNRLLAKLKYQEKGTICHHYSTLTISQKKGKVKSYACLSLSEEILQDQKKNLCFHNSLLLQASSQMLTPVLFHELFPPWLQQQKIGQTSSPPCWSYWSIAAVPWSAAPACHCSRHSRECDVESGTNTLPAPLQRLSHPLQLEQRVENHICTSNSREDEDVCLILCYPNYWSNYFQQHNWTDYILNQWIQFGVEFACSFCDVFFPIFTGKMYEKTLFIILIWKLSFNWSIIRKKCSGKISIS